MHLVLVEGEAKRAGTGLVGRVDAGRKVIFPDESVPSSLSGSATPRVHLQAGDYAAVEVCFRSMLISYAQRVNFICSPFIGPHRKSCKVTL